MATTRFDRAVVSRVDGDRVDVITTRSSNAIRNVQVGGNLGRISVGDHVTVVWSDERPVVLYNDDYTPNQSTAAEVPVFPEMPVTYTTGEGIKLYRASGQVEYFPVTEDGLTEALAASDMSSVVFVPAAQLSGDFDVPGGTTLKGIDKKAAVIQGVITLTGGAKIRSLTILKYQTTSDDIYAIIGPDDDVVDIQDCLIQVSNCGTGDSIAIQMNDGDINIENTRMSCASVGGVTHIIESVGDGEAVLLDCPLSSAGAEFTDDTKVSVYGTSVATSDLVGYCDPGYELSLVQNVSRLDYLPLFENGVTGHISSASLEHRAISGLAQYCKPLTSTKYVIFANLVNYQEQYDAYTGDKVSRYDIDLDTIEEISFTGKWVWDVCLIDDDICYALVSTGGTSCDIYKLDFSDLSSESIWSGGYTYQNIYVNEIDSDYLLIYGIAHIGHKFHVGGYKISTDTMQEDSEDYPLGGGVLCFPYRVKTFVAGTFGDYVVVGGKWVDYCGPDLGGFTPGGFFANYNFDTGAMIMHPDRLGYISDVAKDTVNSLVLVMENWTGVRTYYTIDPTTMAKTTVTGLGADVLRWIVGDGELYYVGTDGSIYTYSTKTVIGALGGYPPQARYLDDEGYVNFAKVSARTSLRRALITNLATTADTDTAYGFPSARLDIRGEGIVGTTGVFI